MATVRQKGDKWQAIVRKKGHKQQSKVFTKKVLAQRWANKTEEEIELGIFKDMRKSASITISECLDRFVLEVLPTRRDKGEVEKNKVKLIRRSFGSFSLANLTVELIEEFIVDRKKTVTNDTIIKDLAVLYETYEMARIMWGIPCINPLTEVRARAKKLKSLQASPGRDRRLMGDEYNRLTEPLDKNVTDQHGKLIAFAVETAMRRGEIASMRWAGLDKINKTLYIREAKHGPRTIPLTSYALEILDSLPIRIDGNVWGMKSHSITRMFSRLTEELGIKGLHFHDLRHEGTSRLFEMGLSIPEVQIITGHGDWRSLQRYTQLKPTNVGLKLDKAIKAERHKMPGKTFLREISTR